jgi:hypothetical protein
MPFSESTLTEIRAELQTLHQIEVQIAERIKALEAILTPFDFGQAGLPFQPPATAPLAVALAEQVSVSDRAVVGINTGLRAAILNVLKLRGPKRAPEVARILEQSGFDGSDSKTPLATRVYNDLWRMDGKGIVENRSGVFSVKAA